MSQDTEYEEVEESVGIDLDEIAKKFEDQGFFKRLKIMFKGLSAPKGSRENKLARIELQRLAAPLIAIVAPVLFVGILIVVTAIQGQTKKTIVIDVAKVEETEELQEEEEEVPDDPEPTPPEDVEITVDNPTPGPVSMLTPVTVQTTSADVSVKPAPMDSVAIIKSPVTMKSMTGSRTPGSIGAATKGGGKYGDATTEATVLKVLWWLKTQQNADGSIGKQGYAVANTGFALLTYLAHGEYPGSPSPYRSDFGPVVQKAVQYLCDNLKGTGLQARFTAQCDPNEYSFLIATYALCEAYGMTKNPNCKEAALIALDRIVRGQGPTGGFDYKLNQTSQRDDLSFAGWAIQALKAGKMAGLHPDGLEAAIEKAISCLKKRSYSKTGGFTYTPMAGNTGGSTGLTGVGVLAMQLLGRGSEPESLNGLEVMRDWQPTFEPAQLSLSGANCGSRPQYYCYYAAQCKYQAGMKSGAQKKDEETWVKWNTAMKKTYPSLIRDLPDPVLDHNGKPHKQGYFDNKDALGNKPVMDSCLVALQLMVYYRYLPTTSVAAGKDHDDKQKEAAGAVDKTDDVNVTVEI